jgi:hypothetical protein
MDRTYARTRDMPLKLRGWQSCRLWGGSKRNPDERSDIRDVVPHIAALMRATC